MAVAIVSWTVDPLTVTPVTARVSPFTVTANADVEAVVAFNASLYVNVNVVPAVLTAAELNVGAVRSTVELFVTDCDESEIASLPTVSCTALFAVELSEVGAVYDTVTVWPAPAGDANVSCTVDPLTVNPVTPREEPFTVTANADVEAVVAFNASLYVNVNVVPAVFTAAELNVGRTLSAGDTAEELGEFGDTASAL
jgi:hypothetical protein